MVDGYRTGRQYASLGYATPSVLPPASKSMALAQECGGSLVTVRVKAEQAGPHYAMDALVHHPYYRASTSYVSVS